MCWWLELTEAKDRVRGLTVSLWDQRLFYSAFPGSSSVSRHRPVWASGLHAEPAPVRRSTPSTLSAPRSPGFSSSYGFPFGPSGFPTDPSWWSDLLLLCRGESDCCHFWCCQDSPARRLVLCHLLGTSGGEATRWWPVRQGSGVPSSLPPGEHAQTLCSSARILLDGNTFNLNLVLFSYFFKKYNINTICHYSLRDAYYAGILICFTNLVVIMACECLDFKTLFAWSFESCL